MHLQRNFIKTIGCFLGMIIFISAGCSDNTSPPTNASYGTLSAKINGQAVNFTDIKAGSEMMGMWIRGSTANYSIAVFPGGGGVDTLKWYSYQYVFQLAPSASLNDYKAIKDVGALAITDHDWKYENIRGAFEFAIVDSTLDTIRVTEGSFSVHYIGYD